MMHDDDRLSSASFDYFLFSTLEEIRNFHPSPQFFIPVKKRIRSKLYSIANWLYVS